jgi:hypothetical protein
MFPFGRQRRTTTLQATPIRSAWTPYRPMGAAAVQGQHAASEPISTVTGIVAGTRLSPSTSARVSFAECIPADVGPLPSSLSPSDSVPTPPSPSCAESAYAWGRHRADRAWIEWGICWPPFTVRRPACVVCGTPWPCTNAIAAHRHIAVCRRHHSAGGSSGRRVVPR